MTDNSEKPLNVSSLLNFAFDLSAAKNSDTHKRWISASFSLGSKFTDRALITVQNIGRLDMLLRSLEEDRCDTDSEDNQNVTNQIYLSELWISSAYEIFRIIKNRCQSDEEAKRIHDLLQLLRVPFVKYEIPQDKKLKEPLTLGIMGGRPDEVRTYDKEDRNRSIGLPGTISDRGSAMWRVINVVRQESYWVERLYLSDAILTYGEGLKASSES